MSINERLPIYADLYDVPVREVKKVVPKIFDKEKYVIIMKN